MLFADADRHVGMLPTYYLYLNCSKLPENTHELEINRKNHLKHRKTKVEKLYWHEAHKM